MEYVNKKGNRQKTNILVLFKEPIGTLKKLSGKRDRVI